MLLNAMVSLKFGAKIGVYKLNVKVIIEKLLRKINQAPFLFSTG